MSKRFKKNEIEDLDPVSVEPSTETDVEVDSIKPKVPFVHWFEKQVRKNKIRSYQDEALLVFFKKQGLKNTEDEDSYDRAFKKF